MTDAPADEKLPRVLSHSAHELRTPLSVVLGYIGFVLTDKKVEVSEQHRQWLELAQKSCGRLTDVLLEMSELSKMEEGKITLTRMPADLRSILAEAIAALPVSDRGVDVELSMGDGPAIVQGDAPSLKSAFTSIVLALRLEVVTSPRLYVQERSGEYAGRPVSWIVIGDVEQVEALRHAAAESLGTFNECRGNIGMSLWIASWVLNAHGGAIWSPGKGIRAGAVVVLPHA